MPASLPPQCAAVRVNSNCSNACLALAGDVVTDQSIVGLLVYIFFLMLPIFSVTSEGTKSQLALRAFLSLEGLVNAAIMSWRLWSNLAAALGEETCLWLHPYVDGAVYSVGSGGFLMAALVATSPPMVTTIQQGFIVPLALFWANFGHEKDSMSSGMACYGNVLLFSLAIIMFPTAICILFYLPFAFVVLLYSFPLLFIFMFGQLFNTRWSYLAYLQYFKFKHRKALRKVAGGDRDAEEELPMCLREDWEEWMVRHFGRYTLKNPMYNSKEHLTFRTFVVFWTLTLALANVGAFSEWSLFLTSWQRSVTKVVPNGSFLQIYKAFITENLDDAFLRFFGRFTLPAYLENFVTPAWWSRLALLGIDSQMFIATINSVILFVLSCSSPAGAATSTAVTASA